MKNSFYTLVDSEIQKALSDSQKRITPEKIQGKSPCKIRRTFYSAPIDGRSRLINILALPSSLELDDYLEVQLIKLRDSVLSKGYVLVVVSEEKNSAVLENTGQFIEDSLFINSPNFLWLTCGLDQNYKTMISSELFEDLHKVIHDLWQGILCYDGPVAGLQQVNLEMMRDECPRCHKPMTTVTGLAFPDMQLKRWDNADWSYYNQLLPLSELNGENARSIQEFVTLMRKVDPEITPVRMRHNRFEQTSGLSASCPHCKTLRGDFEVIDDRMQYLHSLESRITGQLKYYSISLNIDQELIDSLVHGFEDCNHTCINGWKRKYPPGGLLIP